MISTRDVTGLATPGTFFFLSFFSILLALCICFCDADMLGANCIPTGGKGKGIVCQTPAYFVGMYCENTNVRGGAFFYAKRKATLLERSAPKRLLLFPLLFLRLWKLLIPRRMRD